MVDSPASGYSNWPTGKSCMDMNLRWASVGGMRWYELLAAAVQGCQALTSKTSQTCLRGTLGPTENSSHLSSCLFFLLNSVADRTSPRHSKIQQECNSSCRKSIRRPSGDDNFTRHPKKSLLLMLPSRGTYSPQPSITTYHHQPPAHVSCRRSGS